MPKTPCTRRSMLTVALPACIAILMLYWSQSLRRDNRDRFVKQPLPAIHRQLDGGTAKVEEVMSPKSDLVVFPTPTAQETSHSARIQYPPPTALVEEKMSLPKGSISSDLKPAIGAHRTNADGVFTVAYGGFGVAIFRAFIGSLNITGFTGDVVVLLKASSLTETALTSFLSAFSTTQMGQINVVVYAPEWLLVPNGKQLQADKLWTFKNSSGGIVHTKDPRRLRPIATLRFELYWLWLQNYAPGTRFLLTDFKDVVFQRNPFNRYGEGLSAGYMDFFEELADPHGVNGFDNEKWDRAWISSCFGKEALDHVLNFKDPRGGATRILCSGTVMGDWQGINAYLQAIVAYTDKTTCSFKGVDQGFHNQLYYSGEAQILQGVSHVRVHAFGEGLVITIGTAKGINCSANGLVLNYDGNPAPVVHQFNRHKYIQHFYFGNRFLDVLAKNLADMPQSKDA